MANSTECWLTDRWSGINDTKEQLNQWCSKGYNPCSALGFSNDEETTLTNLYIQYGNSFTTLVYGTLYPILVLIAITTNIPVVIVLAQKHMRQQPTNVVLLYMAISDLFVALVPLPIMMIIYRTNFMEKASNMQSWHCNMHNYMNDSIPQIWHTVAMWLTVLLAVQRFICIEFPAYTGVINVKKINMASLVIFVATVLAVLPYASNAKLYQIVDWTVYDVPILGSNNTIAKFQCHVCLAEYSDFAKSIGLLSFFKAYTWLRATLFTVIPSLLLIVFSGLLICSLHRAQARRNRLMSERRQSLGNATNKEKKTTHMLVLIVVLFLIVNLPQSVVLILFLYAESGATVETLKTVVDIDNLMILLAYPINFFIYCSMSSQFRDTFKTLCFSPASVREKILSSIHKTHGDHRGPTDTKHQAVPLLPPNQLCPDSDRNKTVSMDLNDERNANMVNISTRMADNTPTTEVANGIAKALPEAQQNGSNLERTPPDSTETFL